MSVHDVMTRHTDMPRCRRSKNREFSRKRNAPEGAYVNYINDRNKEFNRQISRAYDKYTVEIRQNLERGTAI